MSKITNRMRAVAAWLLLGLVPAESVRAQSWIYDQLGRGNVMDKFRQSYRPVYVPGSSFENSTRLERLMRAGKIYLSLEEAVALAIENNLDLESARYGPRIADSDILRASAGQILRGISTNIRQGANSASSAGVLSGASALGNAGGGGGGGDSGLLSGLNVQLAGAPIPNLDPNVYFNFNSSHNTRPQTTRIVTGTNFLVSEFKRWSYGVEKSYLSGTTVNFDWSNNVLQQNSPNNDFNPTTSANVTLTIQQRLLRGFGLAVNSRAIRVAKNNRHVSDLVFLEQVIATVGNVIGLYYDLVSFNEELKVRQQALQLNEKLYDDNRKRLEIGTVAPADILQAEAEVAASRQQLLNAETTVMQQEMILKNVLTRTGVDNLMLMEARIIPTTPLPKPGPEGVQPVQDLIARALAIRPEIEQAGIQLENARLNLKGTRSALMPSFDVFAQAANNALAGQVNSVPIPNLSNVPNNLVRSANTVDRYFLGGYGTVLGQLLRRNFPDYTVGFQLNMPLRNRSAQADLIRDQLNLRQQEITVRQLNNAIRLNVINAHIALQQTRAAWETAVKARELQERTLRGEQTKYELGTSTLFNVVLIQRDLVTRLSAEASAVASYVRARTNLEAVTGEILTAHNVEIEEARQGQSRR
ncbi:MAG: TolC family protein [Acidobacteria bacterium]|nr:TolC family protein [Acidobacteriota bacterium]